MFWGGLESSINVAAPRALFLMVCSKARERRGEAERRRALYYNWFNAIYPCLVSEDASALVAWPAF